MLAAIAPTAASPDLVSRQRRPAAIPRPRLQAATRGNLTASSKALTLRSCSTAATQPSHSLLCDCSCRVIPWHRPGGGYTAVTQLWTPRAPSSRPPGSLTRGMATTTLPVIVVRLSHAPFPRPHTRSPAAASPRHAPRPLPQPQTLLKERRGGTRAKERVAEREQKRQRAALRRVPVSCRRGGR